MAKDGRVEDPRSKPVAVFTPLWYPSGVASKPRSFGRQSKRSVCCKAVGIVGHWALFLSVGNDNGGRPLARDIHPNRGKGEGCLLESPVARCMEGTILMFVFIVGRVTVPAEPFY